MTGTVRVTLSVAGPGGGPAEAPRMRRVLAGHPRIATVRVGRDPSTGGLAVAAEVIACTAAAARGVVVGAVAAGLAEREGAPTPFVNGL